MKWSNLKINKCPKCDKDFAIGLKTSIPFRGSNGVTDFLMYHPCQFQIRESRYRQIVNSQITQALEDKWDTELIESNP